MPRIMDAGRRALALLTVMVVALLMAACDGSTDDGTGSQTPYGVGGMPETAAPPDELNPTTEGNLTGKNVDYVAEVSFTLRTTISQSGLAFVGVGGDIDGIENPTLNVAPGQTVQITLENGDGAEHDIVAPDLGVNSARIVGQGSTTVVSLGASELGQYSYWCSLPGHRAAGMEGSIIVGEPGDADEPTGQISCVIPQTSRHQLVTAAPPQLIMNWK